MGRTSNSALEMFQWPVEWSALHGIAEIRTPILKMARNTDMMESKRVLRRPGSAFPEEGARGDSFALKPSTRPHALPVLG